MFNQRGIHRAETVLPVQLESLVDYFESVGFSQAPVS
jgi:hypothetical protein